MTVKECIKKNGIQSNVEFFKMYQSVDIDFVNPDGRDDETEFDITGAGTKAGTDELSELFFEFCQENKFRYDTVISITVVASAYTKDELDKM